MSLGYNYTMVKEFEAGWAKFQRQEASRENIRKFIKALGQWISLAAWATVTVAIIAALGAIVWTSILLQPWEVGL